METGKTSLAEQLKRDSHRICSLILNSELEWIDIAIEINRMRELCAAEAPDKLELFEVIYVSRFVRLWEQWRAPTAESGDFEARPDDGGRLFSNDDDDPGDWGLALS